MIINNPDVAKKRHSSNAQKKGNQEYYLLHNKSAFDISEAYKAARTNMAFVLKSDSCKLVGITSPMPGEGKTTTAANLAITFAQAGLRVLLADADFRKPKIHKLFQIKQMPGLTSILGGFNDVTKCIISTKYAGLDVLPVGPIPPNPAELLASDMFKELIQLLTQHYDYIFIDTPPINVVTDAAIISKYVTGMLIVIMHEMTTKDAINSAVQKLEFVGARVLGFIMNGKKYEKSENRYRQYQHKYKYGYKYRSYGYKRYGYSSPIQTNDNKNAEDDPKAKL